MTDNYAQIVRDNLDRLYKNSLDDLTRAIPCTLKNNIFEFMAFGRKCRISPDGVRLGDEEQTGVYGMLILLYALNSSMESFVLEPLKAFKDFANSMPYAGAFATHAEDILVGHVKEIEKAQDDIIEKFQGRDARLIVGGDFSFILQAFPKISLCYIFYYADDDFPASVKCLFSNNASNFLTVDALADTGEYTSREILKLVS